MQPRQDVLTVLQDLGYRSTVPRRAIVQTLEGMHEGLTAEDVGKELPDVGRATIFRTLKLLVETGVVCRTESIGWRSQVQPVSHRRPSPHGLREGAGELGEFRASEFGRLMKGIDRDIAGDIASRCIEILITCDECTRGESH